MAIEKTLKSDIKSLRKVSHKVRSDIISNNRILREVTSNDEKIKLIENRRDIYDKRGVAEPCSNHDPFDEKSRFFVLETYKNGEKYISKVCRLVNRKCLGILPTELNLKNNKELNDFFGNNGYKANYDILRESTLNSIS